MKESDSEKRTYDYLGKRIHDNVFEAGVDPDEIADKIDYSKQAMVIGRRQKRLAKKAMESHIERSDSLEVIDYEEHGIIYTFADFSFSIRKDDHGPQKGQNYFHIHLLEGADEKNSDLGVLVSTVLNEETGEERVYLEPHNGDLAKSKKSIDKIINTENKFKLRDAAIFIMHDIPTEQRRKPKMKKSILIDTKTPTKYCFRRVK